MAITGFAVAVAVYAIAFLAYVSFVQAPAGASKEAPLLNARAEGGVGALVDSWGFDWQHNPDGITRFGLASVGQPGHLDMEKMLNLTKGTMEADPANGYLDYEEARQAMGLGDYHFHLRTFPLLPTLDESGPGVFKGFNVAYLANYTKQGGTGFLVQYSTLITDLSDVLYLNITITNNGTLRTVFQTEFSVPLADGYLTDTANTNFLVAGANQTVGLKLYKTADWEWASSTNKKVSVVISDPQKTVANFEVNLAAYNMNAGPNNGHAALVVDADKMSFRTTERPKVNFDLVDGEGDNVRNVAVNISVYGSGNALVRWWQGDTSNNNKKDFNELPGGYYRVVIRKVATSSFNSTDGFLVTDESRGEFEPNGAVNLVESEMSKYERSLLVWLVDKWSNTTYDYGGDVYQDTKHVTNNDLATNLTNGAYHILVVGSGVDHNAMTSAAAKHAVREFVRGGGLLIVLGSQSQSVTWLEPLFHVSLTTSGDNLGVPDPTHPILHMPEELNYPTYKDLGRSWQFNNNDDASHFAHIINRNTGGNEPEDILSVSKSGHFGNGTVVLTAWMLNDLTDQDDWGESLGSMYNFLAQAFNGLNIDMGPRIPGHAEVASSARLATAPHPWLLQEKVLVRIVLYVFR